MEITGKVIHIGELQQLTDKFAKREFVVEYAENPQYPETIKFDMHNDRASVLDGIQVGDNVTVNFNLRGRAWENKKGETVYFNTLEAWRVAPTASSQAQQEPALEEDDSGLPF